MSVVLNFSQIEKDNNIIISHNKISGLYEINLSRQSKDIDDISIDTGLFHDLLYEDIWDEVYHKPHPSKFMFYILAMDFESAIGYRKEGEDSISLAFEPKDIYDFIVYARTYCQVAKEEWEYVETFFEQVVNYEKESLITIICE